MFRRLDTWIGKTLFIPIIIRLCQMFKTNQHIFANYAYLGGNLILASLVVFKDWIDYLLAVLLVVQILFCLIRIIAPRPAPKTQSKHQDQNFIIRLMLVCMAVFMLVFIVLFAHPFLIKSDLAALLFLFGAYAYEITTIPPTEIKAPSIKAQTT